MKKLVYSLLLLCLISCANKNEYNTDIAAKNVSTDITINGLTIDNQLLSNIKKSINKEPIQLNREVWNYDKDGNEEHYVLDKGLDADSPCS